jgi:hypothetical protein
MRKIVWFLLVVMPFFTVAQTVYTTPFGKKYHLSICKIVISTSHATTPEQAIKNGFEACKKCKPTRPLNITLGRTINNAKGQTKERYTCNGVTKAGLPCKNLTKIQGGFCYHHGNKN